MFPERQLKIVAREVLTGLAFLHNLNPPIVHRDIKADNILICSNGAIKIGDFGASRTVKGAQTFAGGAAGGMTFIGSPYWMAPEVMQMQNERQGGAANLNVTIGRVGSEYGLVVDTWSFGVTMYEMCFGKPPHIKLNLMNVITTIIEEPPPTPAEGAVNCSDAFRKFLAQMLVKKPSMRPSPKDMLACEYLKTLDSPPQDTKVSFPPYTRDSDFGGEWKGKGGRKKPSGLLNVKSGSSAALGASLKAGTTVGGGVACDWSTQSAAY